MIRVELLLFAVLRDIVGADQKELRLPEGTRAGDVWQQLRREHQQLADYVSPPMTAVNESYAPPETELRDGDRIAFIPPVSGG